jgi:hypothetical protein
MYPYTIFKAYKIVDNTMMSHPKHITHSFGSNKGIFILFCVLLIVASNGEVGTQWWVGTLILLNWLGKGI